MRHRDSAAPPAALPGAAGYRFAHRGLALQRGHHRIAPRRGAGGADGGGRERRGRRGAERAGRVRAPAGGAVRGRVRPLRRGRLPRLRDPRRDAALRVHLVGRRAGHHGGRRRHRRPDCVRRADDRFARRRRRSGPGPAATTRAWEAAAAAIEMAVLFRRLGRPPARAGAGRPFGFEPGTPRGTAT